ncbi:MAG: site-specific integrase [Actinomycetota bacterium]|nr:site-specific integrase [Actinomycetota bacterium]
MIDQIQELMQEIEDLKKYIKDNKLSRQYLTTMVKRYGRTSGIQKNISFHTLRHTYATWLYINSRDIETVRQQLRHKSITTTTIYINTAWQFQGHKALSGFQL